MTGRIVRARYRPDQPGRKAPYPGSPFLPFGAFAVSPRVQGLAMQVARDIAVVAKALSPEGEDRREGEQVYSESFFTVPGKPLKIDGLPRSTALVGNSDPKAPAMEFGSGEGSTDAEPRPQGGGNLPFRVLGKAGRMFGDLHE